MDLFARSVIELLELGERETERHKVIRNKINYVACVIFVFLFPFAQGGTQRTQKTQRTILITDKSFVASVTFVLLFLLIFKRFSVAFIVG